MTGDVAPVCTVCVANYNGMEVIGECLDSVFAQDCDFPFEVIVHDDASSDGSADYVRRRYPLARVIASPENEGFCVSNNRMVSLARGQYVLLLNNDASLFPDALRSLLSHAQRLAGEAILGLPQYDARSGELVDRGSLSDPFLNPVPNLDAGRGDVAMVSGACLWISRDLWEKLGGFPAWFDSLAEDMYLACMARLRGYGVQVLPHSGFRHYLGKSLGGGGVQNNRLSTTLRRRALSERNKSFVMALCFPPPLFQLLFPLHVLLLLLEGGVLALLKGEARLLREIYFPCLDSLWHARKRLFDLRRGIQRSRKIGWREFVAPFVFFPHKLRLLMRYGVPRID
jgi:GT2 family glycosyltransferase